MNKKFSFALLFFFFFICNSLLFSQIKPNQLSSLKLWLKADSGVVISGSNVTQWTDVSNNGNNFLQADTASQPTLIGSVPIINNLPSIYFDGGNYLNGGDILDLENYDITIVCLLKINSGANPAFLAKSNYSGSAGHYAVSALGGLGFGLFYGNSAGNQYTYNTAPPNGSFFLCTIILNRSAGLINIYVNGSLFATRSFAPESTTWDNAFDLCLGSISTGGFKLNGEITELAYFISALNTSEVTGIETYFVNKYFPPVNLGADIYKTNFCDTLLDAGSRYVSFLWSTADTTQSISVTQAGTYWVSVTDAMGFSSSDTINITYPAINLSDTIFCSGNSVTLSTGLTGTYSYNWSSGPTTPTIDVNTAGNYSVTVTDGLSCTAASPVIVVSEDTFPLTASLGPDTSICSGNSIGLVAPLPLPPGLTYVWSTFETSPQIAISDSGNYSVTVTDSTNCIARDTIHVTIGGTAPDADFNYIPGCSGTSTSFSNSSLPSGDSWLWDFGDGQTDTAQNPTHIYANKGTYTVSLTVFDSYCSNNIFKSIYINGTPTAAFSADTACANHAYNFTDQSSSSDGTIVSWDWDFGDATLHSTLQNPPHTYTAAGSYNVTLTVTTDSACQSSAQHAIIVVTSASAPGPFTLYQPVNNYFSSDTLIDFGWNSSAGAASYTLEYSTDSFLITNVYTVNNILTTTYQLNLPTVQTYYWRVIALNICGNQMSSEIRKVILIAPAFYSGMQLWLKADSGVVLDGNNVTQWTDQSNNGNNLIQTVSSAQPLHTSNNLSLNNLPSVYFDGNDNLNGGDILDLDNHDITAVCLIRSNTTATTTYFAKSDYSATPGHYALAAFGSDFGFYYSPYVTGPTPPDSSYFFCTVLLNRSNGLTRIRKNGSTFSTVTYTPESTYWDNTLAFCLGSNSNGNYNLNGEITELLFYDTVLNNNQINNIESYLVYKYAPPVNLGPDINIAYGLCDTILDAGGRFTNYLWSTGDTTQTISITQSGQYSVTATNIFGQVSHDDVVVNLPSFMIQDTAFCLGSSLALSANLGSSYNYLWLPDSATSETFTITQPGNYSLSVFDTIGCQRTIAFSVTADSFAVQASLGPDRNICQGDIITLTVGAQQATSYLWSNSTGNNYLLITDAPGSSPDYSVTVTDHNGCTAIDTISLHIIGALPVVSFISDSVCFGNPTHFTDLSTVVPPSTIASRYWEFGDNDTSIIQDPVHTYAHAGPYQVQLTVTTDSGCVKKFTKGIIVYSVPEVSFLPYNGCSGKEVPFTDLTFCPFGNLTEWHWDFGDTYGAGTDTSSLPNPIYVYDSAGTYTVKLITSSVAGCTDSTEHTVTINQSPQVAFSNSSACAGLVVYFTDETVIPPWETITEHHWHFGDGTSSSAANPSHVYDTAGTYEVSLLVSILNGCSVNYKKQIVVGAIPEAGFGYADNCIYGTTHFTDNSTSALGAIDHWIWNFGSTGSSTDQNPGVAFPDTGIYNVILTVKTEYNCEDNVTLPVRIYPLPDAAFSFTPEYGIPPLPVSFTNHSTGAATYLWAFGDSDTDVSLNPSHTYLLQGIFDVLLTAYNTIGCSDTISHKVYVLPTTVDIVVSNTTATQNGTILNVSANLMNNGSRKIEHIDVALQLEGGNVIHEQWYGALMQGEFVPYIFSAQPEVPGGQGVNYVCVTASLLPELQEDDVTNNRNCEVLNTGFTLSEPYPNPVISNLVIAYVLPFSGNVKIELFNEIGEKVMDLYDGEKQEGYNAHTYDLSALGAGVYSYRILFHENSLRKKFVKM